jgi:myo-inositol-1(or 4)-monophosphatase
VTLPGPDALLPIVEQVAREAGELLMSHHAPVPRAAPRMKGLRDPVTEADLASERHIVARLKAHFPEVPIHAEEETREAAGEGPDAPVWYVDPLDGTVNFSQSHPFFAVSIALYRGVRPVVGVVHAPALRETFTAAAGRGTRLDGAPLRVSSKAALIESVLATGFAYRRHELADDNVARFADMVLRVRGMRRAGSAALDLAFVAAGRLDGYWEPHLNCFDVAAGALLVREAGGLVTDLEGGDDWLHGRSILAAGPALHPVLAATLAASAPTAPTAAARGARREDAP